MIAVTSNVVDLVVPIAALIGLVLFWSWPDIRAAHRRRMDRVRRFADVDRLARDCHTRGGNLRVPSTHRKDHR